MINEQTVIAGNNVIFGTSLFSTDLVNHVFCQGKSDVVALAYVNKQFAQLATNFYKNYEPEGCFGSREWKQFKADPGIVPQIPLKMIQLFDASNFMLTLIPETLNGAPLTLSSIDLFVSNCKNIQTSNYRYPLDQCGISDETVEKYKAHWVILSKDLLDRTIQNRFKIQKELVKAEGFNIPNLIDVVVSLFLHNLRNPNEFIYPDDTGSGKLKYTRVQEKNKFGSRIVVGCFSGLPLNIDAFKGVADGVGAACSLKSIAF